MKKSLGQNFLTSQSVVDKIISTANLNLEDVVLEVGPGKGILTEALLEKAEKVVSVEKDDKLILFLKEKFKKEIKNEKLILIHGDILTFDFKNLGNEKQWGCFSSFLEQVNLQGALQGGKKFDLGERNDLSPRFKIVANIPYYITGELLRKTLSSDVQPSSMVLLVQKEVAERIAKSKKESILSISVKAYGEPKYIQTVKRGSFAPAPKVDSAILSINNISKDFFTDKNKGLSFVVTKDSPLLISEKRFFEVVKVGFAHKRKFLINNLSKLFEVEPRTIGRRTSNSKEKLKKTFTEAQINEKARAEDLSLEQWKNISKSL